MKRMKISVLPALLLFAAVLSGCVYTDRYKTDYTEKYKAVLDQMLGDWEIEEKTTELMKTNVGLDPDKEYIYWKISYKDKDGKQQVLEMKNIYSFTGSLANHFNRISEQELKKTVGELPYEPSISYTDAHLMGDPNIAAYDKHPEKIIENYSVIYNFKNFNLQSTFKKSAYFISLYYDFPEELSDEEEMEIVSDAEKKILATLPEANLKVKRFEGGKVFDYFIEGKKVAPEEHPRHKEYKEKNLELEYLYYEMLRERVPHFNIEKKK
ncbi:MAG TPA: hypothetical protein VIG80_06745 [Bacillaceae bacterium]